MYLIDTPLHSSNVVNRLYCNSLTTDNAEDERSYKGVIAKDERRMIRIGIYLRVIGTGTLVHSSGPVNLSL